MSNGVEKEIGKLAEILFDYMQEATAVFCEKRPGCVLELFEKMSNRIMVKDYAEKSGRVMYSPFISKFDDIPHYFSQVEIYYDGIGNEYDVRFKFKNNEHNAFWEATWKKALEMYPEFKEILVGIFVNREGREVSIEEGFSWQGDLVILMKFCERLLQIDGYVCLERNRGDEPVVESQDQAS